ncbi:beta-galactosidase trimerization domain-containing protein [Streptomyces tirandamycinicus]|uniref:beta-galactosidase trimerization domain-containing protein n=1 Tax=Streptomyces tirandamycinicus TaxID=2174846 RepID=UPI00343CB0C5
MDGSLASTARPGGSAQAPGPARPGGSDHAAGPARPGGPAQAAGPARPTRLTLEDGALRREGRPYFAAGFNYHPSQAGCAYWHKWDPGVLDADFRRMAELGFNTVRFFVFWADFEPAEGVYDAEKTGRLRELARIAERHGLYCLPSLLTIWMNGQRFEPDWRRGRDLWHDESMAERQRAFVEHIAGVLRDAPNILAYDLGDEVIHVDSAASAALSPEEVRRWWALLAGAIRGADPAALVLQANEASAVTGGHAFRPEHAGPLDLVGLHGFPVWSPFHIEAVDSVKASSFVPYLVRRGRADTAVLVDELGSYGCDEATAARYLRATAHSAFAAGAAGTAVWCWQDFTTEDKPYALRPNERFVGLVDADGRLKPAMDAYREFAARATGELAGFAPAPPAVGVFLPEADPGDAAYLATGGPGEAAAFYAHLLLQRAHLPYAFARPDDLDRHALVVCPSVRHLSLPDQQRLRAYVARGGTLLYTTGDLLHAFGGEDLFGIRIRDYTLDPAAADSFTWQGVRYPVHRPPGQIPLLEAAGADVLAAFPCGAPALTRHRHGRGTAYHLSAPLEEGINAPYRLEEAPWHLLYAGLARAAGIEPEITADEPAVETTVLHRGAERCAVVVNHAPATVHTTLRRAGGAGGAAPPATEVVLEPKGVRLVRWNA